MPMPDVRQPTQQLAIQANGAPVMRPVIVKLRTEIEIGSCWTLAGPAKELTGSTLNTV